MSRPRRIIKVGLRSGDGRLDRGEGMGIQKPGNTGATESDGLPFWFLHPARPMGRPSQGTPRCGLMRPQGLVRGFRWTRRIPIPEAKAAERSTG
jgi:hypothetical protein